MRGGTEGKDGTYTLADAAVAFGNYTGVGAVQHRYLHSKLHSTAMAASVIDFPAVNIYTGLFASEFGGSVGGIDLKPIVAGCP